MDIRAENEKLAKVFDDMAIEFKKDRFRKRAYETAATAIRRHDKVITSGSQAQKEIKGIGKSIATKIDEIIKTGTLKILTERPKEKIEKENTLKLFEQIYGVGPKTAEKWYDMGYHTFESLVGLYPNMTDAQKLGYYYFTDLQQRIPRAEMDIIGNFLEKHLKPLNIEYIIAGSYRRGELDSGDVDILVKEKEGIDIKNILSSLVNANIIVGNLAVGPTKYMGIIKLGPQYNARRIDIRIMDDESWPYSMLYFTGSKQLNVEMRKRAIELGLSLNEYALTDKEGNKYPAKTEKDIFDYLGMEYLEPTERSVVKKIVVKKVPSPTIKKPIKKITKTMKPEEIIGGKWYRPFPDLFVYVSGGISTTGNIAAFDLDWTLTRTFRGIFPKDPEDITLLPNRVTRLKQLIKEGYTIVVFTNQKSTTDKKKTFNYERMNNFIKLIPDIPIILMMATGTDQYRKPNVGMWLALQQMVPQIKLGFFSGDAAGRAQDFSDSDRKFAENIGIRFYTPEQIFPSIEKLSPLPQGAVDKIDLPVGKNMVLFVGAPGTGKTTYYNTYLKKLGYIHANQDILKTKAKVLKLTRETMGMGNNIVIDATNPGQNRRQEFYDLANKYGYNVVVIYFVRDGRGWNKLRPNPVPPVGYGVYYKYLVEPTPENTPGPLYQIF